ncbi:MAG: hypothetical protein JWO31_1903 [Phycisphaerales bacterium]|nr:hypothetical protein [Phycisphaerales bacterium]
MSPREYGDLLGEMLRSTHQPSLRKPYLEMLNTSLDVYEVARLEGKYLHGLADGRDVRDAIFSTLFEWREHLDQAEIQMAARRVERVCHACAGTLNRTSRSETAFLLAWTLGAEWYFRDPGVYCRDKAWAYALTNLVTMSSDETRTLKTLFGLGRGSTAWEQKSSSPDADRVRSDVGLSRPKFDSHVAGSAEVLFASVATMPADVLARA